MQKNIIFILIILTSCLGFSQNIKSITELKKQGDSLVKNRFTEFDKNENLVREVKYGRYDSRSKTYRNKIRTFEYKNGQRVSEYFCEDFVSKDTCVLRSFSTYEYNTKTKVEKQTKYEPDLLIRFIREIKKENNIRISKTNSWELSPVKELDFEKVLILADTSYFDKKKRLIKRVNYHSRIKEPYIEKYVYSKNKYTYQIIGTARDTILTFEYNKLQKEVDRKSLDYIFNSNDNYEYKIEYH